MGSHSLLLLALWLSCYVHYLPSVAGRHHTRNLTTVRHMADRFGAANLDDLTTSDESSEAPIASRKVKRLSSAEDESDSDVYQGVMGRPGVDFPILPRIPRTTFNCRSVPGPGYYADMDTDCQVFHICDGGRKISFLCPNGTIFRQSQLTCDWWWTVDCASSRQAYDPPGAQPPRRPDSYSKQLQPEKSYRSTTYNPPNALREGRNIYNNFALNTTSARDRERQQPAETASFVNSRRNNGSRQYEVVQRNSVHEKGQPAPFDESSGREATGAHRDAFAYSRKAQPAVSERRGGRPPSVRWSGGEFRTVADLPPTSRQGQRGDRDGYRESGGIFVTESSVRNSKYQSTGKQYVELDRSKTLGAKPESAARSQTVTPIVVRNGGPSTVGPEDLPITDIFRPTGAPFTLEDERGGRTTPRAEHYVASLSDKVRAKKPAEITVAVESDTEPISDVPITDVNPPKELWFTHEDFAFVSTKASEDFDSTRITPQPDTVSTPAPEAASFDDEKIIERSETEHTATVYLSSNNDHSVTTIVNCSGLSHDKTPSGVTSTAEESGREIQPTSREVTAFNGYTASESTAQGTELPHLKQTTEKTFRKETISHMTASSSDLSLSITENKQTFYKNMVTTDFPFNKEVTPPLSNERRTLSFVSETLEPTLPDEPAQSSQSLETDYVSPEKSYRSDGKFSQVEEIESNITPAPSIQKTVSRGILAPLPLSDITGKEYQPQGNDLQYHVTTPHGNKEDIFESSESFHARVTDVFTPEQASTVSTLMEQDRETQYDVPVTPAYDADATESTVSHRPGRDDSNAAVENGRKTSSSLPPTENPPALQSVLPAEVLGDFAAATSRYDNRNAKEVSHPAKDAPLETTEKSSSTRTAVESVTGFRRRMSHGRWSSAETTSSPATSPRWNRLPAAIFVEGPRRRLTTTTTTPSVIQRVLSLRQKTTPLTIPLRSTAVTPKATSTSEQLSKSLLPPKVQEIKSLKRGSQSPKSRTGVEHRINKTRSNIPPSNRPDTLNSLAVYFGLPETEMEESDVSSRITKMMNDLVGESVNNVNASTKEIPVQLPPLLTQLTRDSYSALFSLTRKMADMDEVLGYDGNNNNVNYTENSREGKALYLNETQSGIESLPAKNLSVSLETSNGLAEEDVRGLRELAQIFSRALTAYLKDPTDFRRVLSQARPTEPANYTFETDTTTPSYETTTVSLTDSLRPAAKDDDEVLDYSDVNKAPTLRLLSSTFAPMFDSSINVATVSKPKVTGSEGPSSATASDKSKHTATESVSFGTQQTITDSSETVYERLNDQETSYNFLTTRDPLVHQQSTVVDSTNAIAYEVNNLFVTETSNSETVNDYTLPPGSQKYTGPAYGPTSYSSAPTARNQTKSRFGGFQNNSVQFQKADTKDELVYDLIVNEEIPPLSRVTPTYSLGGKEVTYILTNDENKDPQPTAAGDLEFPKTDGVFMLTTKASFDELSTLQESVIPAEVNNLVVTKSTIAERLNAEEGLSTTVTDENASETPSTIEATDTVSVFPSGFSNKHKIKGITESDNVNQFVNVDNLKSKHSQGSTKDNGEEFLIVSGTSGFGASLKQQSNFHMSGVNKQDELETKYNSPQTNNGLHGLNQDKNSYPVHRVSSVPKPNEVTDSGTDENPMTELIVMNGTHESESMGKQSHMKSFRVPIVGPDTKEEPSSPTGLPHVEVTQDSPSQETMTPSWEDYDVTDKQTDTMDLNCTLSSSTLQAKENEKIVTLANDQQKIVPHSPITNPSLAFTGGAIRNIQIDGISRMSVNTFTSAAPHKLETITKRTQKSRSDNEMATKSPKVTISSRGFSFATTVDETRDILEQGRASLLQSSTSASARIDMTTSDPHSSTSDIKVHSDSRTKDKEIVNFKSQDYSTFKMVKDNVGTDYSTVTTDIKSATHPSLEDQSEWKSADSESTATPNLVPNLQLEDFSTVTMQPAALPLLTTLEAPAPSDQLHMKRKSVNNHLSRAGKQLNVVTHHTGEISSTLHHDEMTTELTPDSEVTLAILSQENNSDHFMSDSKPVTILENNKDSLSIKELNDKNDILPSTSITIGSRKNRPITSMTHEEKETLNHLQEIFSLDTATVAKAGKLFMELNETSRHALTDMMKEAASNSTMRQLVLVVVNKSLSSMNFSDVKKNSVKNQTNLPCDENVEPQMQKTSTEHTSKENTATERKHLGKPKGRQSLTTTEPPVTTYHSQDKKYQRFKSVAMPTTSVFDLITSKNHTSFDEVPTSKPGVLDRSQLSTSVSEPEENVSSEADARVVELLRSLYSLAAKWG